MQIKHRIHFILSGLALSLGLAASVSGQQAEPEWWPDLAAVMNESVDRRLADLAGGETNMAVFSDYNHRKKTYTRNKDLWCADLGRELTGGAVFKVGPNNNMGIADSYGGVMITRRHILFCNHAHPAYPGSPPPWVNGLGFNIYFVTSDDEVILRELIWGRRVKGQDLWIGLLDEDLPETVKSYRIFPEIEGLRNIRDEVAEVGFSQGSSRLSPERNYVKFNQLCGRCETSHYGTHTVVDDVDHYEQPPMIYVSNTRDVDCTGSKGSELRAPFRYCVWDGDSGTPRFHLLDDELLLTRIITSSGGGGISLGDKTELLNATIVEIDRQAVLKEKIEEVTEHEVEVVPLEELEKVGGK